MVSQPPEGRRKKWVVQSKKREREKYGFGSRCVMHFRCWVKKEHHSNKHLFVAALADRNFTCMRLAFAQILSEKDACVPLSRRL